MPELTDTRLFYPEPTGLGLVDICERLVPSTAFEQAQAWQIAHNANMDSFQGFYGRTMRDMLSIGFITHRENDDQHRKVYKIEWDIDDDDDVQLPTHSPALFRIEEDDEEGGDYWYRACDYLTDQAGWCIADIGYVPSISEGDDHVYFAHDFDMATVKEYIDLGDDGVLLVIGDYIVGCGNKPLYVFVDREYDEPRDYIAIDHNVHYLDTMKSISMSDIEVINE